MQVNRISSNAMFRNPMTHTNLPAKRSGAAIKRIIETSSASFLGVPAPMAFETITRASDTRRRVFIVGLTRIRRKFVIKGEHFFVYFWSCQAVTFRLRLWMRLGSSNRALERPSH